MHLFTYNSQSKNFLIIISIILGFTSCKREEKDTIRLEAICLVNDLDNNTFKVISGFEQLEPYIGRFKTSFNKDSLIHSSCRDTIFIRFYEPYETIKGNADTLFFKFRDSCKVGDLLKIEYVSGENHLRHCGGFYGWNFQMYPNVFVTKVVKL